MNEEIEYLKDETKRLLDGNNSADNIHKQQASSMKEGLLDLEARKNEEIDKLKDDISKLYATNSDITNSVKVIRNEFSGERNAFNCRIHAISMFNILTKWKASRMSMFFRIWSTNNTIMTVAAQFKKQVKELLQKAATEAGEAQERALEKQKEAMLKEQEQRVSQLCSDYDNSMDSVRASEEEAKQAALEELAQQFDQTLQVKDEEWQAILHQARNEHQGELKKQAIQFEAQLESNANRFELEKADFTQMQRTETEIRCNDLQKQLDTKWGNRLDEKVKELEDHYHSILSEHAIKHKTEKSTLKKECDLAIDSAKRERDHYYNNVMIVELNKEHEQALANLKEECNALEAKALDSLHAEYALKMSDFRQDSYEETEARIRLLRSEWDVELKEKIVKEGKVMEEGFKKKIEDHVKQYENERLRGIKLETTKWKQVVKDMEKRYELELTQAREKGFSDRDANARVEIHEITTKYELKLEQDANLHKLQAADWKKESDTIKADHAKALVDLKNDTVWLTERDVRMKCEGEFATKINEEIEKTQLAATNLWQGRLLKEQERMEKFKEDTQKTAIYTAAERRELQERVDSSDEIVNQIKALCQADKANLMKDFESERDMLEAKHEKAVKQALKEQSVEQTAAMEVVTARIAEQAEIKIKANKQVMETELDECVAKLHADNDQIVATLEVAMKDLKNQKDGIVQELEQTTTKLEDTEDTLYDLQQHVKKKEREHSFATWKLMTGIMRMRVRFQAGMKEFEEESAANLSKAKNRAQLKFNDMSLVAMRVVALIMENEELRKKMHSTLVSHRSTDLVQKKTHIQLYERELERITSEKDGLEQQRDILEDEIDQLENNVRELEEQIREHNRSSTMQNGRVNVAHARKKRRLDSELERILDLIEQKRVQMVDLEDRVHDKVNQRDEKEGEIVEIEKQLVQILIEQQKMVLGMIEDNKGIEDKCKMIVQVVRLPYPAPSLAPAMRDVLSWQSSLNPMKDKDVEKDKNTGMLKRREAAEASQDALSDDESV